MPVIRPGPIRRAGLPGGRGARRLPRGTRKGLRAGGTRRRADPVQLRVQRERPEHLRCQEPS